MNKSTQLGENIVFIVGCPRSGTTWLQRLLACNSRIRTGQESDVFDAYIGPQLRAWHRDIRSNSHERAVGLGCYLREAEFKQILTEYMFKLLRPMLSELRPEEIFLEKTPSHALFIPEIMELLPRTRIINVLRDPRDVVSSILAASKSWGRSWAPNDARKATSLWVQHVEAVDAAAKEISKSQFYEVRYEELHGDTVEVLRRTSNFLGLTWDEASLQKAIKDNEAKAVSDTSGTPIPIAGEHGHVVGSYVKEPLGFIRKASPGAWRQDLTLLEKLTVKKIAYNAMAKKGYH